MSLKWIILLLLLVLPIMIADIDTSMGNNNSLSIVKKQVFLRNHRFKRECSGCKCCCCGGGVTNVIGGGPHVIGGGPHVIGGGPNVIVVCCKGEIGRKEMFRNWWLHKIDNRTHTRERQRRSVANQTKEERESANERRRRRMAQVRIERCAVRLQEARL
uniref:Uncharacterized protein n=1 Tax=Onchocerca volvulus TaxID=6282 RepID=A0A8R1XQJ0_ONCVO